MAAGFEKDSFSHELSQFSRRVAALREVGDGSPDVLDALLTELELAEEELRACGDELAEQGRAVSERHQGTERERALLRTVFRDLPVPVFVLDHAGTIRRANSAAAELLGTSWAYVSGKPFPIFIDLTARAVFRTRLSAVLRGGGTVSFASLIAGAGRRLQARLVLSRLSPPGEARPLVAVAALPVAGESPAPVPALPADSDAAQPRDVAGAGDHGIAAVVRRMDLLSRVTRLLLQDRFGGASALLNRVAWLLRDDAADWVIIDVVGARGMSRAVVAGPDGPATAAITRQITGAAPAHNEVLTTGEAVLDPVIQDEAALGTAGGRPVLGVLGAGSVLSVPLRTGERTDGVLTLVRSPDQPAFSLSDRGLFEDIGEQIAIAVRASRQYQRHSETATALRASLLPHDTIQLPGLDWAVAYSGGTEGIETGGDFHDVFRCAGGWGVLLGDVSGHGEEAAALTGMVRNGVRLLSLWDDQPGRVLSQLNTAMTTQPESDRFVTLAAVHLRWSTEGLAVKVASAGHPPIAVARADGTVTFTAGGGLPLGLFDDGTAHTERLTLSPGDVLLLYSDGVTGTQAPDGSCYGTGRLTDILLQASERSAEGIVKMIQDDMATFSQGTPRRDDAAVLAVRVRCIPPPGSAGR